MIALSVLTFENIRSNGQKALKARMPRPQGEGEQTTLVLRYCL